MIDVIVLQGVPQFQIVACLHMNLPFLIRTNTVKINQPETFSVSHT